jgi:hypothetical protein
VTYTLQEMLSGDEWTVVVSNGVELVRSPTSLFGSPMSVFADNPHNFYRMMIRFSFATGTGEDTPVIVQTGYVRVRLKATTNNPLNYFGLRFRDKNGDVLSNENIRSGDIGYAIVMDSYNQGDANEYEVVYRVPAGADLSKTETAIDPWYDDGVAEIISVEYADVGAEEAMRICDNIWSEMTTASVAGGGSEDLFDEMVEKWVTNVESENWSRGLTKLQSALRNPDEKCRILVIGDSLSADFYFGCIEAMIESTYGTTNITILCQQDPNAGCWNSVKDNFAWAKQHDFTQFDLVVYSGTSQLRHVGVTAGVNGITQLTAYIRDKNPNAEFILISPLISVDSRAEAAFNDAYWVTERLAGVYGNACAPIDKDFSVARFDWWAAHDYDKWSDGYPSDGYSGTVSACRSAGVAYWDLTRACYEYLYQSGLPIGFFNRDAQHSNRYGKQFAARIVFEVLKKLVPPTAE